MERYRQDRSRQDAATTEIMRPSITANQHTLDQAPTKAIRRQSGDVVQIVLVQCMICMQGIIHSALG